MIFSRRLFEAGFPNLNGITYQQLKAFSLAPTSFSPCAQINKMHFTNLVSTVAALALTATKVAAVSHGEVTDYNGADVKWQQLGKGMWTGVPVDEWDDTSEQRYIYILYPALG